MADYSSMRRRSDGTVPFNGPQRAVDAMANGQDPNADRAKKGAEYGMGAGYGGSGSTPDLSKSRTKTPSEVYEMAKAKVLGLKRRVLGGG